FVPQAIAPTFEDSDWRECVDWTDRQTAMVALWGRHIRNFAALTYGVFDGSVLLGIACALLTIAGTPAFAIPALLFLFDLPVAVFNGWIRREAVFEGSPSLRPLWRLGGIACAVANLFVP